MTSSEKLQRDIDTLRESIRLFRLEIATIPLNADGHHAMIASIGLLVDELHILLEQKDHLKQNA